MTHENDNLMTDALIEKIETLCHEYTLSTLPKLREQLLSDIKRTASYLGDARTEGEMREEYKILKRAVLDAALISNDKR